MTTFDPRLAAVWPSDYLEGIAAALAHVDREFPDLPASPATPIFVLAAGWRSGSTLVQRLLNSDAAVAVFGEPFEHMGLWHQLAGQWKRFGPGDKGHAFYLEPRHFDASTEATAMLLTREFIATLSPPVAQLKRAHWACIETLLAAPATALGRSRWGFKAVRCDATVATYLRWLYRRAGLVFLVRHPVDAWRSYKSAVAGQPGRPGFHLRMPTHVIGTAGDFALHWAHCAGGFAEAAERLGALVLRFEDLQDGAADALEQGLGVRVEREVLEHVADMPKEKVHVGDDEIETILAVTEAARRAHGYG